MLVCPTLQDRARPAALKPLVSISSCSLRATRSFSFDCIVVRCLKMALATLGLQAKPETANLRAIMSKSRLDYVVAALNAADVEEVAAHTKISKWTLRKIRQRQIVNPGVASIDTLHEYFKRRESRRRKAA